MVSDYLVSGAGLALSFPPLVMFDLPAVTAGILGLMSLGFAIHGFGVVRRQRIRVETDEDGLWFSPPRRRIAWNEITRFGLAWFSTRRDGARGWMELKVASPRRDPARGLAAGAVQRARRPRVERRVAPRGSGSTRRPGPISKPSG